jgi:hypothetical protein
MVTELPSWAVPTGYAAVLVPLGQVEALTVPGHQVIKTSDTVFSLVEIPVWLRKMNERSNEHNYLQLW